MERQIIDSAGNLLTDSHLRGGSTTLNGMSDYTEEPQYRSSMEDSSDQRPSFTPLQRSEDIVPRTNTQPKRATY